MSLLAKRLLMLLMGCLAALMAWPCLLMIQFLQPRLPSYLVLTILQGLVFGLIFGAVFGSFEGIAVSSRPKAWRGMVFGAVFGLASGSLGMLAGQGFLLLSANQLFRSQSLQFSIGLTIANGLGWMLVGLFVALIEGLRARSGRKCLIGLAGGLLGGLIGGATMQSLMLLFPDNSLALLSGLLIFGLALAMFYSLFERRFSAGTLRLLNGPLKGKDYPVSKNRMVIGSDDACDIVLKGYPEVLARHAELRIRKQKLLIVKLDKAAKLLVNDDVTSETSLRREDVIALGKARFFFGYLPLLLCVFLLPLPGISAQATQPAQAARSDTNSGVVITQIDSSKLLLNQSIRLFVDAPQLRDAAQLADSLRILESPDGQNYSEQTVLSVDRSASRTEGISFFFLLDNSGSMWENLSGQASTVAADWRINHARQAIQNFLGSVSDKDRVGLAVFNSRYWLVQACSSNVSPIIGALDELERPKPEDAYTELYTSVQLALRSFGEAGRRRVLIVLSDGENYPYYERTGKPNPQFGDYLATPAELIEAAAIEGISIYSLRLGPDKDSAIAHVARQAGGAVFDANNQYDMENIYESIRQRVLDEYSIVYRAAMFQGGPRQVRLELGQASGQNNGQSLSTERQYWAGTILGWNRSEPHWYYLVFIFGPMLLIAAFVVFKLEKESSEASLQLLYGFKHMPTKVFTLGSNQTIIGGSAKADLTIAGNPALKEQHATILFDEKSGNYTIVGEADLTVNNKTVTRKRLEAGDVINMAGTVVVFDDKLTRQTGGDKPGSVKR